jgi:hypothetical protein
MKGYIYTMYAGADPGHGWVLNDPIFGNVPTLGACVPNIRRAVEVGDYIFAISGRVPGARQFVVGGFQVAEKIHGLEAYDRFPQHRVQKTHDGMTLGNVIVLANGRQSGQDAHENFERRVENYIVGRDATYLDSAAEFDHSRRETLKVLSEIVGRKGERVFDIIGRQRKLDSGQVTELMQWLESIKQ